LVDHGSASRDQTITNAVDGLQIELVIGLDWDEAHVLALHSFGDCLRIHKVVLVGLHVRPHKPRTHQPDLVTALANLAGPIMGAATRLHRYQARSQLRHKR